MLKRTVRVSLAILQATEGSLLIRSRRIYRMMKDNPLFSNPDPTMAVFLAALDLYDVSCQEAVGGGEAETIAKNAAKAALISLLRQLSYYVQLVCKGERAIIVASGFQATKDPVPAGVLGAPGDVRVSHSGISGQFSVTFDKVWNAATYQVQSSKSPDGPWEDEGGFTSTRILLDGFTPGVTYWFTVYAIGAAGNGAVSSPISLMAI